MAFEKLIEEFIKPGIKAEMNRVLEEEIAKATNSLQKRLREVLANVAVDCSHFFDIRTENHKITITFDDKTARVSDLAYNAFERKKKKMKSPFKKIQIICPYCQQVAFVEIDENGNPSPCVVCGKPLLRGMLRRMEYFPNAHQKKA